MTPPRRFDMDHFGPEGRSCDGLDLECLKDVPAAPDMTRRIMGRLGYMRASERAIARARQRRLLNRAAVALVVLLCGWIGLKFYEFGSWTRKPDAVTLPTAIGVDLARHEQRLDSAMQTIHRLTAHCERLPIPPEMEADSRRTAGDADAMPDLSMPAGGVGAPMWLAPYSADM